MGGPNASNSRRAARRELGAERLRSALELQEGRQAALKAVYLDERNPYSHYAFAIVSIFSGELEQAIRAARKAIEISPSFALGHLGLGMALVFSGRASEAVAPLEHGLRSGSTISDSAMSGISA